jgi:hypothetical protein
MTANRIMWIFAALFVVFGLLLAIADDASARNLFGGLSIASLGIFAFAMAFDGIAKGQIRIQFDVIKRDNRPRLFRAAVVTVCAAGAAALWTAVWFLFLKAG